jgi:hypothetical protein
MGPDEKVVIINYGSDDFKIDIRNKDNALIPEALNKELEAGWKVKQVINVTPPQAAGRISLCFVLHKLS